MIKIEKSSNKKFRKLIFKNLSENNKEKCQWFKNNDTEDEKDTIFIVRDQNVVVGGAVGYVLFDWYFLDFLWIKDNYRKKGLGTELIQCIEKYAKERDLKGVRMETWDFQAKGFYEKLGYTVFGTIEDCPPGTINYFFLKRLK